MLNKNTMNRMRTYYVPIPCIKAAQKAAADMGIAVQALIIVAMHEKLSRRPRTAKAVDGDCILKSWRFDDRLVDRVRPLAAKAGVSMGHWIASAIVEKVNGH